MAYWLQVACFARFTGDTAKLAECRRQFKVVILGVMMFFLVGGDWRQLLLVLGVGSAVSWIVLRSGLFPTGPERINSFLSGIKDPTQYSDHVKRAIEAFVQGGWFGVGLGNSRTKLFGLPFPHTDSIFAVVGEELGVLGAVILVVLFTLLLWRGLTIAGRSPDGLGSLLAGGLAFWLALEAFINMAVMVNLMPFAGNALPFISYGGSNLVVSLAAVGILLNVSRLSVQNMEDQGRFFGAVVNLRWRDRRRRVSGPYRSSGADLES